MTLKGLPKNPEEQDNYYKEKGPIPKFSNDFGCIQDLVSFSVNTSALGKYKMCSRHYSLSTRDPLSMNNSMINKNKSHGNSIIPVNLSSFSRQLSF